MAVVHSNIKKKEESGVRVSGRDAKKIEYMLFLQNEENARDNLDFLSSVVSNTIKLNDIKNTNQKR